VVLQVATVVVMTGSKIQCSSRKHHFYSVLTLFCTTTRSTVRVMNNHYLSRLCRINALALMMPIASHRTYSMIFSRENYSKTILRSDHGYAISGEHKVCRHSCLQWHFIKVSGMLFSKSRVQTFNFSKLFWMILLRNQFFKSRL
jgi:hypothetical protein